VLAVFVDGVDAEAIHAAVEPETKGTVIYSFAAFFIIPV
jgi:hypothetical protein